MEEEKLNIELIEELEELRQTYDLESNEAILISIFRDIAVKIRRNFGVEKYTSELEDIAHNGFPDE